MIGDGYITRYYVEAMDEWLKPVINNLGCSESRDKAEREAQAAFGESGSQGVVWFVVGVREKRDPGRKTGPYRSPSGSVP